MSLTPINRASLLQIKAQREEADRLSQVQTLIRTIYAQVVQNAARTATTSYKFPVELHRVTFIAANLGEILAGLQVLFPDCVVEYAILTKDQDGQLYDVSKMDKQVLPFIGLKASAPYIVVDWT